MKQPIPYADKYKQFKSLSGKVNKLIRTGRFGELSRRVQEKMLNKLKNLYNLLSTVYSSVSLKKILATAAVFLGLNTVTNAQIFAPPVKDTFNLQPTYYMSYPNLIDLDGDGDLDILSGDYGQFQYYKNTGTKTSPKFANPIANPFGLTSASYLNFPVAADLDGDGDYDLLSIENYGNFQYFKNTGTQSNPIFAAKSINPFGLNPGTKNVNPTLIDIDGDGDLDLFVGNLGSLPNLIQFYENTGSAQAPQFAAPVNNPFNIIIPATYGLASMRFADMDLDGDYDLILAASEYSNVNYYYHTRLKYFENTGSVQNPSFAVSSSTIFPSDQIDGLMGLGISLADLDDDGDLDMMLGGMTFTYIAYSVEGSLYYFKNISFPSGIAALPQIKVNIAPNPASDIVHIHFDDASNSVIPNSVTIVNIIGQKLIREKISANSFQLDVSLLPPGNYFIVLKNDDKVLGRKKITIIEK